MALRRRGACGLQALVLLALTGVALPLKDVRVVIPRAVERLRDAELKCLYNMEEDKLYQIKWYKGQNEFFRYTPGEPEPIKVFSLKGVQVVKEMSNSQTVWLRKVDMNTEGRYACEVSADAPSFATSMKEDRLVVVDIRDSSRGPNIGGLQDRYRLGDVLRANCTSEPSHPPANVTIYVDDKTYISDEHVKHYKSKEVDPQGRKKSIVGIEVKLLPEHFGQDNKLKIRCVSTVYNVYTKSDTRSVELRQTNVIPPNAMETNQPTRAFDTSYYYIVPDETELERRRKNRPDVGSGARPLSAARVALPLLAVGALRGMR